MPADWLAAFNIASSATAFFGGFACSYLSDRFGRRAGMLGGITIVTSGVVGEIASTTKTAFLISKLVLGLGLGFYLTIGPIYCSEVSSVLCTCNTNYPLTSDSACTCSSSWYHHCWSQSRHSYWPVDLKRSHCRIRTKNRPLGLSCPLCLPAHLHCHSYGRLTLCTGISMVSCTQGQSRECQ